MTEAAPDRTKPKAPLTEYIVLEEVIGTTDWRQGAKIGARSGEDAVKRHAGSSGSGGVFVAVPARSWQPVKVTAKVETTLVVEDVAS